jgi:hypothetical protein
MTRNRIVARAVLTAGLAVGASLATALPAYAHGASSVTCNGTISATTVGSVTVADGTACTLNGVKVKGGITVGAGAVLDATDITVYHSISATNSGRLTAAGSEVYSDVTSSGTGLVRLTDVSVAGDVTATGEATSFNASDLYVGGDVSGTTVSRFDVSGSYVLGTVTVNESFNGGNVCDNWVNRGTRFAASGGAILIGGATNCAGNTVRGSVVVENNAAYIAIDGNTVRRNLTCTGNDPVPVVGTNTVAGTKSGQCA